MSEDNGRVDWDAIIQEHATLVDSFGNQYCRVCSFVYGDCDVRDTAVQAKRAVARAKADAYLAAAKTVRDLGNDQELYEALMYRAFVVLDKEDLT